MFTRKFPALALTAIAFFMSAVMISGCQSAPSGTAQNAAGSSLPLPKIPPDQIKQLFPDTVGKGKPIVVDFSSKFCLACQEIKPKLEKLAEKNPGITLVALDIQHPKKEETAMLKAFKVVTVPYVVFISKDGVIKQVFLEDASEKALQEAADTAIKG